MYKFVVHFSVQSESGAGFKDSDACFPTNGRLYLVCLGLPGYHHQLIKNHGDA